VFPTGIQGNDVASTISINSDVKINNIPFTELPFPSGTNISSTNDTCGSADCSFIGSSAEPISLPAFPPNSASEIISFANETIGEGIAKRDTFGRVTILAGTTDFSNNFDEYFINELRLQSGATLRMKPGTYWIGSINIASSGSDGIAAIEVEGAGVVNLYVAQNVDINSDAQIRGIEGSALLNLVVYNDLTLASDSMFSGIAYVQNNLQLNSNSIFTGTVSAGNAELRSDSIINYESQLIVDFDLSNICEATVDELIAYYQFDAASGQTVTDYSGFNRDANLGQTSSLETTDPTRQCVAGSASLLFDSAESQVVTGPSFKPPSKGAVAFWMKIPSIPSDQQRILGFSDGFELRLRDNGDIHADLNVQGFQSIVSTSSVISSGELNTWIHFAFTTDITTGNWQVFKNGVLDASGTTTLATQPESSFIIGGSPANAGETFNGELDDVRVYSGELSASAIATLASGTPQDCADEELLLHYTFDEGTGQVAADSGSLGLDGLFGLSSAVETQDPSWQCELSGALVTFDSSQNQRVTVAPFTPPEITSVAFWLNIPSLPSGLNRVFGSGDGFEVRLTSSGILFADLNKAGGNSVVRTLGAISEFDTWIHFVMTTNAITGDWAIYKNGILDNSGHDAFSVQPEEAFHIGGRATQESSQSFNGSLDDFRLYSGTLSNSIISSLTGSVPTACPDIDHYELLYSAPAVTCEAANLTLRACVDAACTGTVNQAVSAEILSNGVQIATASFTGSTNVNYSNTAVETVTLSLTNLSLPAANELQCNGVAASTVGACQLEFVDATFQIFGENIGNVPSDQVAEANFQNINLRAVQTSTETGACEAALSGNQTITLGHDCVAPNICVTGLSGASIAGDGSGESTANVSLNFDGVTGIASLGSLFYDDAGRIAVSAVSSAHPQILRGVQNIDVVPSYLRINITNNDLVYNAGQIPADAYVYSAGEVFEYSISAHGASDSLLPNYQGENLALQIGRLSPSAADRIEGLFSYRAGASILTTNVSDNPPFTPVSSVPFTNGIFTNNQAHYTETGRITIDVRDNDYLGNVIASEASVSLGTFIPAYYVASTSGSALLNNAQINLGADDFTYVGQYTEFGSEPAILMSPRNALGDVTANYVIEGWVFNPDLSAVNAVNSITMSNNSVYSGGLSVLHNNAPVITPSTAQGGRILALNGTQLRYEKVTQDGSDTDSGVAIPLTGPFSANLDLTFSADFLTDSNGRCNQLDNDSGCLGHTIPAITGADVRYGRLALESNFGAETDDLVVPVRAEYYDGTSWRLNTLDNHTQIDFDEALGHVILTSVGATDLTGNINNLDSDGLLQNGLSDLSNDLRFNRLPEPGQFILQLSPLVDPNIFPYYLNFDWNNDGAICNAATCVDTDDLGSDPQQTDFPNATVTFGLYRGNDRIIQWREVFN
jgi:hypothetical protein